MTNDLKLLPILDSIKYLQYLKFKASVFDTVSKTLSERDNRPVTESSEEFFEKVLTITNKIIVELDETQKHREATSEIKELEDPISKLLNEIE